MRFSVGHTILTVTMNHYVLLVSLLWAGGAAAQSAGTFTPTGSMATPRQGHTATLLHNGKVVIAGGISESVPSMTPLASAELYDPLTATFSPAGNMIAARFDHTATLLPDGRVLIAGGETNPNQGYFSNIASAEIYDPAIGAFKPGGQMTAARSYHTATLLNNGKVLLVGGTNGQEALSSAELYDPLTGTFSATGGVPAELFPQFGHLATLLADGKVLLLTSGDDTRVAAVYDPVRGSLAEIGWPNLGNTVAGSATLLTSGKVLITLHWPECETQGTTAESYDYSTGQFAPTQDLATGTCWPTATTLSDGTVLLAAGPYGGAGVQVYDPVSATFSQTGDLTVEREGHAATLLPDGTVLISGGGFERNQPDVPLATAELYHPAVVKPPPVLLSIPGGQAAIQHASTYQLVSADHPAAAEEVIVIYCTGLIDGSLIPPQVAIGGQMAQILYFGATPGYSGLNQINVRVPNGLTSGSAVPVRLNYLDRPSNEVSIAVQL